MSLTFIHDFQNQLYLWLSHDAAITEVTNKIYFGAVQDGKAPFLLINISKVEDLSLYLEAIYSVEFQISAYAKDQNHQLLTKLADRIVKVLESSEGQFLGYMVAGIKANSLCFEKAKDLVLNKLTINYKALIKKEVYDELS
jgi:hypothetical protein